MKKTEVYKTVKKALAIICIFSMALSGTGCKKTSTASAEKVTGGATTEPTTEAAATEGAEQAEAETLSYTYNDYLSGSPDTWNPHEWETSTDSYIMTYTQMGLYDFILNDSKDAYEIIPEMAAAEPVDVTADYAGNETYGVPADATDSYAFKIALNEAATWEDGTPINADTYIYSMQQMLSPEMKNYRASSFYSGTLTIANAEAYYKQNSKIYTPVYDSEAGAYREVEDADMFFTLTEEVPFFGDSAQSYYEGGYDANFMDADGNDLYKKYEGESYIALTDEAKADLLTISAAFGDSNPEAYKEYCFTFDGVSESVDWSRVGLIKTGDYEITLVLSKPITDFYLKYSLSSNWIVYEKLYEANKKQTGDMVKTTYGTSVDSYMSYGPYKLTEYQVDKQVTMAKNENWYGYTDGKHEGQFQTTAISTQIVSEQATRLQLFLQGKLDNVDLVATDMDSYRTSDFIMYTPESYTSKLTFNTDKSALKKRESAGINKTILSYKDFRKAFSLCIDRTDFAAQCTATHSAGYGILNYMYVYDPESGELYRNSEEGEKVLTDFYGVDSVDDITGYDKAQATELFVSAYEAALAAGDITATDTIELEFLVYSSDDSYVKIVNFIQEAVNEAVAGTELEGRINIKMTPDADYYDHAQQGGFEMIISTWGGSSMDPYGIMECYCVSDKIFEYGFNPEKETTTIEVNGESLTKTFNEWYEALCNGEYAVADSSTRLQVLAGMELGLLNTYDCTPMYYRTAASLESRKIVEATDEYVQLVAFGGIRFLTYNYDDAAWDAYCTENNSQLTY